VFSDPDIPEGLWFIAGNHEDFDALESLSHGAGCTRDDFPVDYYQRVHCVRDGHVVDLPGGLRLGGLWGIDDEAPNARRRLPSRAYINRRSANKLAASSFDVLLTHESPRDAVFDGSGSEAITELLRTRRPLFAFFGHYHSALTLEEGFIAPTALHLIQGLEFRGPGNSAEDESVGVLRWGEEGTTGQFEYVASDWLRTVTRHNWVHR
jgi:hypothetical protein